MKNRFAFFAVVCAMTQLSLAAQTNDAASQTADSLASVQMMDYKNPKQYIIRNININGVKYLDTDILTASAGLQKGDSVYIPGNYISQAIAKMWSQRYFSDIKVIAEPLAGDSVDLEIYLQERPRVYRWLFDGIRKSEATTLTEDLKLKRGSELSDYVLEKNMYLIKQHYEEKGFRNLEIHPKIENDSVISNAVNVTFVIDKHPKVKIGELKFEGNEVFTDARLRRSMKKIHQRSINIFNNTKLKSEEYEADKENILDFYNSHGYRNANIVKDSVYVLSDNRIGLTITVDEGNRYYFRNISWTGNSTYPTDRLNMMLGIKQGDPYDKKTLYERLGIGAKSDPQDISTVSALYQNNGYLASQIDPSEIIIGEDSIDLEIKVFEGNQYRINNVNITGNTKVNDEVVRREINTRPGELYSRAMLMQTISQLAAMGHFDEATIQPGIQPVVGSNDLVDITWPLSEKASDKFEVSGGWGSGMFVGSVGIVLTNISTRNLLKKDAWRPYPHGQNQQLSIRAQTNGTYYSAFSLGFTEPWLGGKKPNSLSVSAYWSEETTDYYSSYYGLIDNDQYFRAMGISAGLGRRLSWPDPYFTLYNEIGYQAYSLRDWGSYFIFSNGRSNIITLKTILARNSTDSPIYPTKGSDLSLSLTLTPPISLLNGKDYTKLDDQEKYKWVEYHKWVFNSKWYYPLSSNNKLVLMCRADLGYLGHYNSNNPSPFEGFDVGGDGMSGYNIYGVDVISMRGYEDGALTPSSSGNSYASLYNKYTVELRYPVIMQPQSQIYGLIFAEGGNAWNDIKDFNPFQIKRAAGVGVRLYLNVIGLLGIDWGYGFDKAYGASKRSGSQFHFVIGQQF